MNTVAAINLPLRRKLIQAQSFGQKEACGIYKFSGFGLQFT